MNNIFGLRQNIDTHTHSSEKTSEKKKYKNLILCRRVCWSRWIPIFHLSSIRTFFCFHCAFARVYAFMCFAILPNTLFSRLFYFSITLTASISLRLFFSLILFGFHSVLCEPLLNDLTGKYTRITSKHTFNTSTRFVFNFFFWFSVYFMKCE